MGSSTFTSDSALCNAPPTMRRFAGIVAVFGLLLAGCGTSQVTNLTTRQPRNPSGLYPVEFVWSTDQQTIMAASIKPFVVVGTDFYPMRPSLGIANRWETVIPVTPDKNFVLYHFKVEYLYRTFGKPQKSSKLSPSYRLDIVDK
jgi:hypothetical protein